MHENRSSSLFRMFWMENHLEIVAAPFSIIFPLPEAVHS